MSEFDDKLNSILSDPDAMGRIMDLARSLGAGSGQSGGPPSGGDAGGGQNGAPAPGPSGGDGGAADLGNLLGRLDPDLVSRLLPLVGELTGGGGNDERMQLLRALRPFLRPERRDKVERAARAARLILVGKRFFASLGDGHV